MKSGQRGEREKGGVNSPGNEICDFLSRRVLTLCPGEEVAIRSCTLPVVWRAETLN